MQQVTVKPDNSAAVEDLAGTATCSAEHSLDEDRSSPPDDNGAAETTTKRRVLRLGEINAAVIFCLLAGLLLGGLVGWQFERTNVSKHQQQLREQFLEAGRQAALNLTTINFQDVDADVQRVLDSATGSFRDEFQKRSPAFVAMVKQVQSKSQGTIAEAGVESVEGDKAQLLVAVTVTTSGVGIVDQRPRGWRMRIGVQKGPDGVKVSNVEFVP